ncbi:MAG TPA: DNA-binding response regulator [Clostridium sp.]|nr:DNA-binding response regulator [Clostridium sp.]
MRILVVDDDNIIRKGLKKLIERLSEDNKVIADLKNGSDALDYIRDNQGEVDLVVTDIKMPKMTGIELIEKASKECKEKPLFVVLSGYDEFSYVRDTMKLGAFNYLLKPIKTEELEKVLKEARDRIGEKKNKESIMKVSLDILKKDFFKKILFSKKDIEINNDSILLDNIQLDENYVYKLIVIKAFERNNVITNYVKDIIKKYDYIEYLIFNFKNSVYILFYFNKKIVNGIKEIINFIEDSTDMFLNEGLSPYILEATEEVWTLRRQSEIVKNMYDNIYNNCNIQKYYLGNSEKLAQILNEDNNTSNNTAIRLAKEYIVNNFNKNITLKDVADEVFLSQNYLSELFKKETGEGFYEFISKYRIRKAKEMLITTNLKVYEVAEKVGYSDSITFGRAFKKITGVTPNSFRNNDDKVKSMFPS